MSESEQGHLDDECSDSHECSNENSNFYDLYKYSSRTMLYTQEKKRKLFLQRQKEKRNDAFSEKRNLQELFEDDSDAMECDEIPRRRRRKRTPFKFKMMKSEFLLEVPEDLTSDWLVKLCPEGLRCLIIASEGKTTSYTKSGKVYSIFRSNLPGGRENLCPHKFTVLDCIYHKKANTLFVFDVLAWNSMSLLDTEALYRFSWLKSKFEENPEMLEINKDKGFHFVLVECFPAELSLLQDQLHTPFSVKNIDILYEGVLFYHKEGHYTFRISPLVGWLKSFMVMEILHIDVPDNHLRRKPRNYTSVMQYLASKKEKRSRPSQMDAEDFDDNNIECDV